MKMVTLTDARKVTERLVEVCKPLVIIVFGSVAQKGVGRDLDLLVIVNDNTIEDKNINLSIHRCLKKYYKSFAVDPFVISISIFKEYFAKGSPFLWLILKEGRYLYMKDAVKEWLKQAEEELNTAIYLLGGGFFKGACYHAQQAIEKKIKALLLKKGWELAKIHSLERLLAVAEDYKIHVDISDEEIIFIDNIYRGTYPGEAGLFPLGEPIKSDAEKAVSIAESIIKKLT